MPQKHNFTKEEDEQIIQRRALSHSYDTIALALHLSRNSIIERARKIGAKLPDNQTDTDDVTIIRTSDPLPPGHDITWKAITDGTVLHGLAYPYRDRS